MFVSSVMYQFIYKSYHIVLKSEKNEEKQTILKNVQQKSVLSLPCIE